MSPGEVFKALLDDLDEGNCPGSMVQMGKADVVVLHTTDDIKVWLRMCRDAILDQ